MSTMPQAAPVKVGRYYVEYNPADSTFEILDASGACVGWHETLAGAMRIARDEDQAARDQEDEEDRRERLDTLRSEIARLIDYVDDVNALQAILDTLKSKGA